MLHFELLPLTALFRGVSTSCSSTAASTGTARNCLRIALGRHSHSECLWKWRRAYDGPASSDLLKTRENEKQTWHARTLRPGSPFALMDQRVLNCWRMLQECAHSYLANLLHPSVGAPGPRRAFTIDQPALHICRGEDGCTGWHALRTIWNASSSAFTVSQKLRMTHVAEREALPRRCKERMLTRYPTTCTCTCGPQWTVVILWMGK